MKYQSHLVIENSWLTMRVGSTWLKKKIKILYTYTAERRDVLGCTSPTTKRFPEAREMSRGRSPRDISRAEGNLEVGGDVQPNTSRFEAVYGHSLIINPSLGMYQEIHPSKASSTYSVKINTSLPMMREWVVQCTSPQTSRFPPSLVMSSGMYNPKHPDSRQYTYTILRRPVLLHV